MSLEVSSKPECIPEAFRTAETVAALTSIVLNLLLTVVVLRCRSSELRGYSKLILCSCFADSLYAVACFTAETHADIRNGMLVMINKGFESTKVSLHPFAPQTFFLFAMYFAIVTVALPLVYRYLAICRNYILSDLQLVMCLLVIVLMACIVPSTTFLTWLPAWRRTAFEKADLIAAYPCHDQMELFISDKFLESSPPALAAIVVINVTYATIVFCAYKVHRFLRSSSFGKSPARQSLQRQIGWALLAQATTPLLVAVLPLGAIMIVIITGAEALHAVILPGTNFCAFIPLLNPLCTLYFIKPYRRAVFGRLKIAMSSTSFASDSAYVVSNARQRTG